MTSRLTSYSQTFLKNLGEKYKSVEKLIPDLKDMNLIMCAHSRSNLQFYVKQGLILEKIHKVKALLLLEG